MTTISDNRSAGICLVLGISIWIAICSIFAFNQILYHLGIAAPAVGLFAGIATGGVSIYFAVTRWFSAFKIRIFVTSIALLLVIISASCSLAILFYDISADGPAYHQPAIIRLVNGWNPIRDPIIAESGYAVIWNTHYAKASWSVAASIYSVTKRIELGKIAGFLLLAATFLLSYSVLKNWGFRNRNAIISSVLFAFNPVCIYQSCSFYVDGLLASAVASFIMIVAILFIKPDTFLSIALAGIFIFGVNLKFTGLIYFTCLAIGAVFLFVKLKKSYSKNLGMLLAISLALSVGFFGFNPYITNTLQNGHPFFPLRGNGSVDIIKGQLPDEFLNKNHFSKLLISVFGQASNDFSMNPKIKMPFAVMPHEIRAFRAPDVRISGFGPLFSGALILCVFLIAAYLLYGSYRLKMAILFFVVATGFVMPESWWARYAPQLWLLPITITILALYHERIFIKRLGWIAQIVLLLNIGLVFAPYYYVQARESRAIRFQLDSLRQHGKGILIINGTAASPAKARLDESHLRSEIVLGDECRESSSLSNLPVRYCLETSQSGDSLSHLTHP
jgi:hypothetical protein